MSEKELLDHLIETIKNDLIVWEKDGYYRPKDTKQDFYKKVYDLRELVYKETKNL